MYEYPFGNGQQLNLDWFLAEWKNLLAAWEAEKNGIEGALQAEIDRAEAALADVFAARDAAAQSAANALESKNAAAQSASDASGYLATVRADTNTASNAAQKAAQSESNAGDSQTAAQNAARAATDSQTAAGNSASAAADSQTAAQNAASAAADSQTAAGNSANAAAQSAADAAASAARTEEIKESIPEDYTQLSNDVKELQNEIGFPKTAIYNLDVVRASMATNDTRTPISANAGDTLSVLITQNGANLTRVAFYVFNEENVTTQLGSPLINVLNTYTLSESIIAFGVYFANATFPSTLTFEITISSPSGLAKTFPALIAKTLPAFIADTALVANDFRIVNNILYRITAPIASDGALTPNTNCIATTVSEVLKTLLN